MQNIQRVLCIGAHPDDIEIGMGGTLSRLIEQNPALAVHWLILCGADAIRAEEAKTSAAYFEAQCATLSVDIHGFKDAFLPWQGEQVKSVFEALKQSFSPDLIFTHYEHDRHQDHRLLSQLTWNTWRNHTIMEYEILKWDGDLGQPSTFVTLSDQQCQNKVEHIYHTYSSQQSRTWFTQENLKALMRIRGVECQSDFAEAFHVRKLVW
jgi:LmbE family N-acetylglucosaminyl deacetylase